MLLHRIHFSGAMTGTSQNNFPSLLALIQDHDMTAISGDTYPASLVTLVPLWDCTLAVLVIYVDLTNVDFLCVHIFPLYLFY